MSKINQQDVERLLELVGGSENIASVTHCITRLRFALNDPAKAHPKQIEDLRMVKGCFTNAGQFQVVIGPEVDDYYQALIAISGKKSASKAETKAAARQNMNLFERVISHIAEIFFPLLPALISGGLILGFRNLIGDIPFDHGQSLANIYPLWKTVYDFLWLLGEAIFMFLPVAVCWSTVKKLGGTEILGIVLGITLVSPQLMNAYQLGQQTPEVWNFGWFTVEKVGYQAQVIPSMLVGIALVWIENGLKKIVPSYLQLVIVPVVSLLIAVFLAHTLIGPFGRTVGNGVAWVVKTAMTGSLAPIGATIFGFLYAPLVITGVHQTTLAIDMQMVQSTGGTPVWPLIALSNMAQASAVLGMVIISRKHNEREISVPATISAYLGVTEPALYGINLKYRFPMLCGMIGSALAALLCGLNGVTANGIGVGGLPAILSIKTQFWSLYGIAMLIAILVPLVLTIAVYKRKLKRGEFNN
ncbi:PTS trehalose transporter subunit IIBC [Serratia sp. M24T3]|uniref:PTS trehalose transporter subunit IIBC n=1 Tax=Rouxiella sp. WC2420 TaxID=3234145 RepID=A0AB39VTB8_9GAMM|nr:PTS trehalose transporter subunit IIBC [Serratia sp. M24T3]EIC84696.1 PTS system trehalose(maltose)-specific transporter subunits IIBC [Serratia sp. M24T3]